MTVTVTIKICLILLHYFDLLTNKNLIRIRQLQDRLTILSRPMFMPTHQRSVIFFIINFIVSLNLKYCAIGTQTRRRLMAFGSETGAITGP